MRSDGVVLLMMRTAGTPRAVPGTRWSGRTTWITRSVRRQRRWRRADTRTKCERRLRSLVDPERENRRAFDDQAALIERLGGAEAILRSDEFDFTPVPASRG